MLLHLTLSPWHPDTHSNGTASLGNGQGKCSASIAKPSAVPFKRPLPDAKGKTMCFPIQYHKESAKKKDCNNRQFVESQIKTEHNPRMTKPAQ